MLSSDSTALQGVVWEVKYSYRKHFHLISFDKADFDAFTTSAVTSPSYTDAFRGKLDCTSCGFRIIKPNLWLKMMKIT